MDSGFDALVPARERIKELEDMVAVLTERIKTMEVENMSRINAFQNFQNDSQLAGLVPGVLNSKKTSSNCTKEKVTLENNFHHKVVKEEMSVRQIDTSVEMQQEVTSPETQQGSCDQQEDACSAIKEQVTKKGKKGNRGSMKNLSTRHVALRIMYWGSRFQGFACQPGSQVTVESELFAALKRTKLLIGDVKDSNYSRCGRTDKGVSAIGQLVAIHLRTNNKLPAHEAKIESLSNLDDNIVDEFDKVTCQADPEVEVDRVAAARASRKHEESVSSNIGEIEEIDYVGVLNRVLPDDIRVLGWCPVPKGFHARFSCLYREYKYFFVGANLDLPSMKLAASKFLGEHDFRNFCKMDAVNVHNYRRRISELEIVPFCENWAPGRQVWLMRIKGTAFLWHQIRCIAAVLFMVGQGYESPTIVDDLLNGSNDTRKPQYSMASEIPLVLRNCGFQGLIMHCPPKSMKQLKLHLEKYLDLALIHVSLIQEALKEIPDTGMLDTEHLNKLKRMHIPLAIRQTEPSYEDRRRRRTENETP